MELIQQRVEILDPISPGGMEELKKLEKIGRACYRSESYISEDGESAKRFVRMLIKSGHESVLEHISITVLFVTDRGITHELVRHRHCAFTQESTRYCAYADEKKFPNGVPVIEFGLNDPEVYTALSDAEYYYQQLIKKGYKPEEARMVLPNATAAKLYMTANLREWRSVLKLRLGKGAHPQMRSLMGMLLDEFQSKLPVIFGDISHEG